MTQGDLSLYRRISARLQRKQQVRGALRRLTSRGKRDVADIEALALDNAAEIDLRLNAVTVLMAMKQEQTHVLRDLLDSNDRLMFVETLKCIRSMAPEWAIPELLVRVRTCEDPSKRAVFAWTLAGYSKNLDVQSALLDLANQDREVFVRDHAIESLAEFHSPAVIDTLLHILKHGSASERFWALYSLGTLADPRTGEAIAQYLHDQTVIPDFGTVADEARWALGQLERKAGENSETDGM